MPEYDRIDILKGIDINKINASKECNICPDWCFFDKNFKCEPYLCNGCHDLIQKAMNFSDVAIFFVKGSDYRTLFWYMSKNGAIKIIVNSNLSEKSRSL